MKRFWDAATAERDGDCYSIRLDGKPMRVPGGAALRIEGRAMAEAIAAEWQAAGDVKGGEMVVDDVPLTRLAGTAQDRIAPDPAPTADALAKYAETDLLCYRAERPETLAARQATEWQPWLDWLARTHGARLEVTLGVSPIAQPRESLAAVRARLRAESPAALAALGIAVPALGSVVLGLALADGALEPGEAARLAALDDLYQAERWGEDDAAMQRRDAAAADVFLAARFLTLARAP